MKRLHNTKTSQLYSKQGHYSHQQPSCLCNTSVLWSQVGMGDIYLHIYSRLYSDELSSIVPTLATLIIQIKNSNSCSHSSTASLAKLRISPFVLFSLFKTSRLSNLLRSDTSSSSSISNSANTALLN